MARGKNTPTGPVEINAGPPPASSRRGRSLHPQVQALIEACQAAPGEWFNLEAGSVSTAASRKGTLSKHNIKATIRGTVVYARTMTSEEVAAAETAAEEAAPATDSEAA